MKYLSVSAFTILALAVVGTFAADEDPIVIAGTPFEDQIGGETVRVFPYNVTISGTSRTAGRTVSYQLTDLLENFGSAYLYCLSNRMKLASPKTPEEQETLKTLLASLGLFHIDAYLGAECFNGSWTWLDDGLPVEYNNFPVGSGNFEPCNTNRAEALMIHTPSYNDRPSKWFTWDIIHSINKLYVICQF